MLNGLVHGNKIIQYNSQNFNFASLPGFHSIDPWTRNRKVVIKNIVFKAVHSTQRENAVWCGCISSRERREEIQTCLRMVDNCMGKNVWSCCLKKKSRMLTSGAFIEEKFCAFSSDSVFICRVMTSEGMF